MDAGWTYGTVVPPRTPDEPPGLDDGSAAALLDEAEDHLNAVGAQIMAEVEAERRRNQTGFRRFFKRKS